MLSCNKNLDPHVRSSYYKMARSLNAPVSLHATIEDRAVAVYLCDSSFRITRVVASGADAPGVMLTDALAVSVLAEQARDYDGILTVDTQLFVQIGDRAGAAMVF